MSDESIDKVFFCPICDKQLVRDKEANWQLVCSTKVLVYKANEFLTNDKYITHYLFDPKEPYEEYIVPGFHYKMVHEIIVVMPYRLTNNFGNNTTSIDIWVDPNDPEAGFSYRSGAIHFKEILTIPLLRYSPKIEERIKTFLVFS
jgi:hypothetical protein